MALFRRPSAANEAQQVSFGATDVVEIANALGIELHRWYSERHGVPTTLTAQLQFDEQQRVASLSSLTADGRPFLVDGALVESLNTIANPLQTAPDNFHLTRLGVDIAGGQLNTRIGYRHDEPPAGDATPTADAAPLDADAAPADAGGADEFAALLAEHRAEETTTAAPPQSSWEQPAIEQPPIPPSWDPLPDYPALVGDQPTEIPPAAAESSGPGSAAPESAGAQPAVPESIAPQPAVPESAVPQSAAPQRPLLVFDELEVGPDDLSAQLPLHGELLYPIPGPDRPDYCLVLLQRPLTFRLPAEIDPARFAPEFVTHMPDGAIVATVPLLVIAARFQGTQIAPDLKDLWVNVAYVTDNSVAQDAQLDFSKVHYAAIARINLVG